MAAEVGVDPAALSKIDRYIMRVRSKGGHARGTGQ